ncbi:MAG: ATP-binding protein [Clostridia bacterium]|nr:ATP-binding protein [Clostridia bacterium]
MLTFNTETQFTTLLAEINQYKAVGDYEKLLGSIKKAKECCKRLFDEATDKNRKELMYRNALNLNALENQCIEKLKEQGRDVSSYERVGSAPASATRPASQPARGGSSPRPTTGTGGAQGLTTEGKKEENENIQYEFFGVDVKQFLSLESNDEVTFDDVKGMTEEKKLVEREFFISDAVREFNASIGKKDKRFILLYGVPGTGKTFFAKAVSCELKKRGTGGDVPFFSVVGNQLSDSKVGGSEKNILALFEFCKQFERCVLFIDEFDSVVPDRGKESGDPTVAQRVTTFLQVMDGFNSAKGTLVISATNCPYNLDGAILSRADARIEIPLPTFEVVYGTLNSKLGNRLAPNLDLNAYSKLLVDKKYSNRDISKLINSMRDYMSDAFAADQNAGINRDISQYVYTVEMFNNAMKANPPSTKLTDMQRIQRFKETGE